MVILLMTEMRRNRKKVLKSREKTFENAIHYLKATKLGSAF